MSSLLKFALLIMLSMPFIVNAEEVKKEEDGFFKQQYTKIIQKIDSLYTQLDYSIRHLYLGKNEVNKSEALASNDIGVNDDERGSTIKESGYSLSSPVKKGGVSKI